MTGRDRESGPEQLTLSTIIAITPTCCFERPWLTGLAQSLT